MKGVALEQTMTVRLNGIRMASGWNLGRARRRKKTGAERDESPAFID